MKMQVFFLRANFVLILLEIWYNAKNYNKLLVICFMIFMSFGHYMCSTPSTVEACVSMIISQKKKMLQNILIWYFLWCKNLPQKKTFIAMMHSSWWINYITSSKLLYERMNVSKEVQIECFKIYESDTWTNKDGVIQSINSICET